MKTKAPQAKTISRLLAVFYVSLIGCTDLDVPVHDKAAKFWQSEEEVSAGVAGAYTGLRDYVPNFYNSNIYVLNEVSTDEVIVPTRGGDWYDGGMWEEIWKHSWTPNHSFLEDTWQFIYGNANHSGVAAINSILLSLSETSYKPENILEIEAELKTVRAFYYYLGLDLFGNIPISENNFTPLSELKNRSRTEVFNYVENELKSNLPLLSTEVNSKTYGRATQWVAQCILGKLYLNAEVFTGSPRWQDCINSCDVILNSNLFYLEPDYFSNFAINNEKSHENIFVIPFDLDHDLNVFLLQLFTLHSNSYETFGLPQSGGGVNGFCSNQEYLSLFDDQDIRKKMFLIGQQYRGQKQYEYAMGSPSEIQFDSDVNLPLNFDPVMPTFSSNDPKYRMVGARCAKWEFNDIVAMSNDYAVYRLADVILMKAEAQLRLGNLTGALETLNQSTNNGVSIRSRTGLADFTIVNVTLDGILAERARELSWEGHRRNDMIRLGHFLDARNPEKNISESFRLLFPIPKAELDKNHYLQQNPGY